MMRRKFVQLRGLIGLYIVVTGMKIGGDLVHEGLEAIYIDTYNLDERRPL